MKNRKFKKGMAIVDILTLQRTIYNGGWVYWRDRPKHPSFIMGMTLRTLVSALGKGLIFHAERIDPCK